MNRCFLKTLLNDFVSLTLTTLTTKKKYIYLAWIEQDFKKNMAKRQFQLTPLTKCVGLFVSFKTFKRVKCIYYTNLSLFYFLSLLVWGQHHHVFNIILSCFLDFFFCFKFNISVATCTFKHNSYAYIHMFIAITIETLKFKCCIFK